MKISKTFSNGFVLDFAVNIVSGHFFRWSLDLEYRTILQVEFVNGNRFYRENCDGPIDFNFEGDKDYLSVKDNEIDEDDYWEEYRSKNR